MTIHELQAIIHLADRENHQGNYQEAERIAKDALIPLQLPTDSISHSSITIYSELYLRAVSLQRLCRRIVSAGRELFDTAGTGRDLSLQPQLSLSSLMSFTSFHFQERGKMEIKGKGMMKTYFLENV